MHDEKTTSEERLSVQRGKRCKTFNWLSVSRHAAWCINLEVVGGNGTAVRRGTKIHSNIQCKHSLSLRVDELFGDVERSGSAINLRDTAGEQREMNEHG